MTALSERLRKLMPQQICADDLDDAATEIERLEKQLAAEKYAADNYRRLLDESDHAYAELKDERDQLLIDVKRMEKDRDSIARLAAKVVAECEDHRKQLRKEQLYVQTLADELEAARKDAARYRWLRERDDWVLMPGMRNEGYLRSCLDDQIDLSMGAFLEATK